MESNPSFENYKFNPFTTHNNLLMDNMSDPDMNLFNENNLLNLDTPYLNTTETKNKLSLFNDTHSFSVLHLNIRSLNKKI